MDLIEGLYRSTYIEIGESNEKSNHMLRCILFTCCNVVSVRAQDDPAAAWKPVDTALGRSGQMQPGDVYKFALPRRDMKVVKDGVTIAPG